MFEKEAIKHAFENTIGIECLDKPIGDFSYEELSDELQEKAFDFHKGAEFGYNKANEWHYVKDGDLPKDTTSLYLVRVYSWNFSFSHLYKKYTTYIPTVCEWNGEYFTALDDMAYSNARNINSCVAWKEIVLPELKESK